jgi:hypothetical protein
MVAGIQECLDSVKRHNPDCDIRLYTKKDLPRGSASLVAGTDILRHQRLFDEGGYYVDADCYCFKPLDFDRTVTFGQQEPSDHPNNLVEWAMGSVPGHPILKFLLKAVKKNISSRPYNGYAAQKELAQTVRLIDTVGPEWAGSRYFAKVNRSLIKPASPTLVHLFLTSWVTILDTNWPPRGKYTAGWPMKTDIASELERVKQW